MPRTKKKQLEPAYKDLVLVGNLWYFSVKLKDGTWQTLGGLSGETSQADAQKFAENTAKSWRKR